MADSDYKLPRHPSLAGPRRSAISHYQPSKNPADGGVESSPESRFSRPPESTFGHLEKE